MAASRATSASRSTTSASRTMMKERESSETRQEAAAGCMEWLGVTEAQLVAAGLLYINTS